MTRLTNYERDAYVRSVMNDLPKMPDYEDRIFKAIEPLYVEMLDPKVRAVYKDKKLRDNLNKWWYYPGSNGSSICLFGEELSREQKARLDEVAVPIQMEKKEEYKKRADLKQKVRALAYSCTTYAKLRESCPEFAKYVPQDAVAVCKTLPAVANIVKDFEAAGWPVKKEKVPA